MNQESAKRQKLAVRVFINICIILAAVSAFSFSVSASGGIRHRSYINSPASQSGYTDTSFRVKHTASAADALLKKGSLPSKYNAVSEKIITPVKDQGYNGTCWAFATVSVAETSVIKEFEEYTVDNCNFSEAHLAYFSVSDAVDPLKLTSGDKTKLNGTNFLDLGGNLYFSTFTLAKWFGITDESTAPYSKATVSTKYSKSLAYSKNEMILENALWIPMNDAQTVKQLIMKYGSCAVSYYHDDRFINSNAAYYQGIVRTPNHSVTIVGWDDNYSKDKFGSLLSLYAKPSRNGAWLIKNSYGTSFGKNGYMWLSYEDTSLFYDDAAFLDFTKPSDFDKNYQYDGTTSSFGGYYTDDQIQGANRFKTVDSSEFLTAVSFYTAEPEVTCYYQIYKNANSSTDPTKGTPVYQSPVKCYQKYAGYHTVSLPKAVPLAKGEYFSVVITYVNKGKEITVLCDEPGYADNYGYVYNYATCLKGQSFLKEKDGKWEDLYKIGNGENLRIKAFTKTILVKPKKITVSGLPTYITKGKTAKLSASVSPYYASDKLVWESSDPKVISVDPNGNIAAKDYGKATVTCYSALDNSICESAVVKVIMPNTTGLTFSKVGQDYIKISWNKHAEADYYEVYTLNTETGKKTFVAKTENTSYTFKNLAPGKKLICYTAAVRTYRNMIVKSGYGSAVYTCTRPMPVAKIKATAVTSDSVKLSWSKAEGADEYFVYVYNAKTKKYSYLQKTTGTSVTVTKLNANSVYTFAVTAKALAGKQYISAASYPAVKVKTAPANVAKFTAKKAASGKAVLTWSKSAGAAGYQIYRYDPKAKAYVGIKATTANRLTVSKLTAGQTYIFRIRAYSVYNNVKLYSGYTYVKVKV